MADERPVADPSERAGCLERKGDYEFGFGPFKFRGRGVSSLIVPVLAGVAALCVFAWHHYEQTDAQIEALTKIDRGQRLLACIISEDTGVQRKAQLRDVNSDCRRFARGEF